MVLSFLLGALLLYITAAVDEPCALYPRISAFEKPSLDSTCDIKLSDRGEISANCSGRGLHTIPSSLPHNISELDFSRNALTSLKNHAFKEFFNLKVLNLNFNRLFHVENQSFAGLSNLTTLFMAGNKLTSDPKSVPPGMFSDLANLETLVIEQNDFGKYPDWIFPPLIGLKNLAIDSSDRHPMFGKGFRFLKELKFLQIDSGYLPGNESQCVIVKLHNDTFSVFRNISINTLIITHCKYFIHCENGLFEPLLALSVLELSDNQIHIHAAISLLHPFKGRNMTSITFDSLRLRKLNRNDSYYRNLALSESILHNLWDICVSEVSLTRNNILWFGDLGSRSLIAKCIKTLTIIDHQINWDPKAVGLNAQNMTLLTHLQISGIEHLFFCPPKPSITAKFFRNVSVTLVIPPNLEYLELSSTFELLYTPVTIIYRNTQKLKTVKFGFNKFGLITQMRGLENVTSLDLSGQCLYNWYLLNSFPMVKDLSLTYTYLGLDMSAVEIRNIFQNLANLQNLSAPHNSMRTLPLLPNPNNLVSMDLSYNVLDTVSAVADFRSLMFLDLSYNLIGYINGETRRSLDGAHAYRNLKISVIGNPFLCGCGNLDFIVWLVETEVIFESNRNFSCMRENGSMTNAIEVADGFFIESRMCYGKLTLAFTFVLLIIFVMALVIAYFVGKNPSRVRNLIMRVFGFGVRFLTPADFDLTFYVGYCKGDIPFVFRDLRLALERGKTRVFLHDRDVLPGVPIANGIIDGVTRSWKMLLVVSQDFLDDPWSDFVMSTAVYAMTDLIPDRILVLLVGEVQVEDLPEILINAVDEEFILCVDQFQRDQLWMRLKELANIE